jgi:hypothetical protein
VPYGFEEATMFDFQTEPAHIPAPTSPPAPASAPAEWNPLRAFFGIVLEPRVYARMLYIWLAFPLGLAYFIVLVTLLPLGAGLLIVWVGIAILALTALLTWALVHLERAQATVLLGTALGPALRSRPDGEGLWKWAKSVLASPAFWKGMVFLGLKFPLGLIGWVVSVVLLSVSGSLMLAPVALAFGGVLDFGSFWVDSYAAAWLVSLIGFFLGLLTLHFHDGLGWVWAQLSKLMLVADPPAQTAIAPAG